MSLVFDRCVNHNYSSSVHSLLVSTVFVTRWSAMCNTLATCHEAKPKSVSIITARAAATLECADVLPAEVSPQYSPTSPLAVFELRSQAMDSAEKRTDLVVEKGLRLPAKKGTVEFYLRYFLSIFRNHFKPIF